MNDEVASPDAAGPPQGGQAPDAAGPPQGGQAPAVEAVGLSKTFEGHGWAAPPVQAVTEVSFALGVARTLAVVGESGSGKTTLGRMVVGLERPTTGTVRYFGAERGSSRSASARRGHARLIQMVFQNPYRSLDPRQQVGHALDEVLRLHTDADAAQRRRRQAQLLDLVHLPGDTLDALPAQLSGGQRQRVCIARALAAQPRVIVLDEAVAALDVSVQAQVLNVLADVRDETGVSYLFITHDLAVVRQIADDVVVMRSGQVVERGPAADVLDSPQDGYTRLLRNSVPRPGWSPRRRS
jgi:ABC-type glutathione transport system ATPase component